MTTDVFKEPKMKRLHPRNEFESWSPSKKKRIKENFLQFCDIVLSYTKYETFRHDELRMTNNTSPLDSGGSTADSYTDDTTSSLYPNTDDETSPRGISYPHFPRPRLSQLQDPGASPGHIVVEEDDSYDLVTCFCGKPYAGRPMIECSSCLTWLHLPCAKVRKNHIPETFICERCSHTTTPSDGSVAKNNNNNNKQPHSGSMKKKHRKSGGGSKLTPGKMERSPNAQITVSMSPLTGTTGCTPPSQQLTANHHSNHHYRQQYELVNNPGGSSNNSIYHHHHHMVATQEQFTTENVC